MDARTLSLRQRLAGLVLFVCLFFASVAPASARVTITFWSQEFGQNFPHAFFTLYGTLDATGEPVDSSFGFTPKAITPAILFGNVPGRIDYTTDKYIAKSNAHFSTEISDAQYGAILSLVEEWGEKGDHHYSLNRRNCVHFVAEAMRRAGLKVEEPARLMKKPRSFTQSIAVLNTGTVAVIEQPAAAYLATLAPLPTAPSAPAPPPVTVTTAAPAPRVAVPAR